MPGALGLGAWIALYFLLAIAGTLWVRRYAIRRNLLDHPGERRSHKVATPRGGGLSIVIVMLIALTWLAFMYPYSRVLIVAAMLGLFVVAGVGWIDDHRPLAVWPRLTTHLFAGLLLAAALLYTGYGYWTALAALLVVPVLVNVWNFMDGIDGLATSQAAIAACAYALYSNDPAISALAWALAAACLGFLPFNCPKARIFLGDVGSGALGYLLAFLLVWMVAYPQGQLPPIAQLWLVLPISAFLIDASLTLAGRLVRREPWWIAHVGHAYQQLALRAGIHFPVTLGYALWTLMVSLLPLAVAESGWFEHKIWLPAVAIAAGSLLWLIVHYRATSRGRESRGCRR